MPGYKEASETILKFLRVDTYPLAIQFVRSEEEFPDQARRVGAFGIKMAICQAVSLARKNGLTLAVTPRDINCASGLRRAVAPFSSMAGSARSMSSRLAQGQRIPGRDDLVRPGIRQAAATGIGTAQPMHGSAVGGTRQPCCRTGSAVQHQQRTAQCGGAVRRPGVHAHHRLGARLQGQQARQRQLVADGVHAPPGHARQMRQPALLARRSGQQHARGRQACTQRGDQRLPVRISINPDELHRHPLRLGLSMDVTVNITHRNGPMLPQHAVTRPVAQTDVYANEISGADAAAARIIAATQAAIGAEPAVAAAHTKR